MIYFPVPVISEVLPHGPFGPRSNLG